MLRDNFGYSGSSKAAKEFVDTVNAMAKMLNNITFDMGTNGGTDIVRTNQMPDGLNFDMSAVYMTEPDPPPVP